MKGTPPTPRDSHSCTTVGDSLYVFGGTDGMNPLKDRSNNVVRFILEIFFSDYLYANIAPIMIMEIGFRNFIVYMAFGVYNYCNFVTYWNICSFVKYICRSQS